VEPDSPDGRTYIYPDAATRDADSLADGTSSVAYIFWELDDASGRAPGIQVVTNDESFGIRNCIMASGEREATGPKTCGDPQGSAKRFKMKVTEVETPVDLVFDTGLGPMTYEDGLDDDILADEVEIGRIYRVLQKWSNDTDQRIRNFRVELGFGTGDDFEPADFATDALAFELRFLMDRSFFGQATSVDPSHSGGQDCSTCHTSIPSGAREVWLEDDYATFSPSMFDDGLSDRFDIGFFDDEKAGLIPPQDLEEGDKTQYIDTGSENTDGLDGAVIEGATTANYFDLFGYMFSDNMLPTGIYQDDDGDAATEGELIAWWDGSDWRYGFEQDFAVVPVAQLIDWAERPLSEDEVLEPPRFETGVIDDLGGLNVDSFIYLGEAFDVDAHPTVTFRFTATPMTANTIDGSEDPPWIQPGNEAPALDSYLQADVSVSVSSNVTNIEEGESLTLTLSVSNDGPNQATDVVVSAQPLDAFSFTPPAGCTFAGARLSCDIGTLDAGASTSYSATLRGVVRGTHPVTVSVSAAEEDPDTSNNLADVSLRVENDGGGGGCAYNPGGPFDPTLPLLLAGGIAGLAYRRRRLLGQPAA
jgi:uncharacterized repeat protein (TIGR01451 family)